MKNYKSKYVKPISASILASVILFSGVGLGVGSTLTANAEEKVTASKVLNTKAISYKDVGSFKLKNKSVMAFTIGSEKESIKIDAKDFMESDAVKGMDLKKFNYLESAGEEAFTTSGQNSFDKNDERIVSSPFDSKKLVYHEAVSGIKLSLNTREDVDKFVSPSTLVFMNYDKTKRVENKKILDAKIQANNKPLTIDLSEVFGKEIATDTDVYYEFDITTKENKIINKKGVNKFLADDVTAPEYKDRVKKIMVGLGFEINQLVADNTSFLTFEALIEGNSEVVIHARKDGKSIAEPKSFKVEMTKALDKKPTAPTEMTPGGGSEDSGDGDGNGNGNGDGDNDLGTDKPTVPPKPLPDGDGNTDKPSKPKPDGNNTDKDDGTDKPSKPIINDINKPSVDDVDKPTGDKNPNKLEDIDKDKLTELPQTGTETSNVTLYAGILAIVGSLLAFVGLKRFKKVSE